MKAVPAPVDDPVTEAQTNETAVQTNVTEPWVPNNQTNVSSNSTESAELPYEANFNESTSHNQTFETNSTEE